MANFPTWASQAGARPVSGDFNADGKGDIALVGGSGWTTIPVAFSTGSGTFSVTNLSNSFFAYWASQPGVKAVAGDFDSDGRGDIAVFGGSGWSTILVAFSNGDGSFHTTNLVNSNFANLAAQSGVKAVGGDFNGDSLRDIALVGGAGWGSIPVAFSNGDGTFRVTNQSVTGFPGLASQANVTPVPGDYDADGRGDIALVGGSGWATIPIAFSLSGSGGAGDFLFQNGSGGDINVSWFASEASQAPVVSGQHVSAVSGQYDLGPRSTIFLTGGYDPQLVGPPWQYVQSPWTMLPSALANGPTTPAHATSFLGVNRNIPISTFQNWATTPNVIAVGAF